MSVPNPFEQLAVSDLRRRSSLKWSLFEPDVLPLWVAEMDAPLAEPVVRVLTDAAVRGDVGYPYGPAYAEAFADFAARRWGFDGVEVTRTALVPDVMNGVREAIRLVTGPGDAVVVSPPVYPPFFAFVAHAERRVVEAPLGADGRLDLDALEIAFDAATRAPGTRGSSTGGRRRAAYVLCNPHNPTGVAHTRSELEAVAALAERYGVRVVADEIHGPLVLSGATFVPFLSVEGAESAFVVTSASKAWNLAGAKAGLLIAGPGAVADLARLPEVVAHGASQLGVVAHTAALRDGGPWLDAAIGGLEGTRSLLADLLATRLPQVRWRRSEATYLAWLDVSALDLGGEHPEGPAAEILERGRVALNSGVPFGTGGAGHVRLNYATSAGVLTEAVERVAALVD
ncbi:cystathionine beta-lyase [Mumia flava]|uniref:cysteine-S-conjugate beta-lyase n=1 Tax=Mumia flava TaxID=1348852 RepID=A0A0B2BFU3_9ACTN|nr:aminotransferase class I/II-fold pyridoxal phosphate-dependent enzyme [Mumia flava]PJJ56838.1 cystathionine beta-lyase [Mumia flava]